jgi:hypothetical protein
MAERKGRANATGRNPDRVGSKDRVLIIKRSTWQSPRVSALGPSARALMVEMLSMHDGKNNGTLFLSVRDATDRLGFSDCRAAMGAFEELQAVKLISLTIAGHFAMKAGEVSKAQAWRLNFVDANGQPVSEDGLPKLDHNTLPPKMRARMAKRQKTLKRYLKDKQAGKFAGEETTTLNARRVEETTTEGSGTVEETATPEPENGEKPPNGPVVDSTTHILHHIPDEADAPLDAMRVSIGEWWRLAKPKERIGLAKRHKIEIGDLGKFIAGQSDLPIQKAIALRTAVAGPTGQAA